MTLAVIGFFQMQKLVRSMHSIVAIQNYQFNINDNPKNNILMSENIRQKKLTIQEYFVQFRDLKTK